MTSRGHTLDQLVMLALAEDIGDADITSEATVSADLRAVATITRKAPGVVFGLDAAEATFLALDPDVQIERLGPEGRWSEAPAPVLRATGRARALLAGERVALNFLAHLSGIATLTARFVEVVAGTGVAIVDTRKTTPGLRALEKAAVAAGGGTNHRASLDEMVLVKENHAALAGGIGAAVAAVQRRLPDFPMAVECRTPAEIDEALAAGARRLLLDNMTPDELRAEVARIGGRAQVEASGGITLETLRAYAETGVDWVSAGALTHSAPALDMSLALEALR